MKTTENNKIIAEFMGAVGYHTFNGNFAIIDGKEINMDLYNSDWNWLMEVVEKIESIKGTQIFINGISCEIMFRGKVISKHFNTKIEAVYNACIEFIEWHNLQIN